MDSLFFASTLLLIVDSLLFVVGFVFSKDEFEKRNEWRVIKNGRIDWKNVDAGRLMFFVVSRLWIACLAGFVLTYIGVRYV